MNTDREDLIERYQQFSDEEILKLFTSGNLTELAKSVALREIKTRRLKVPSLDLNSNDKLLINMSPIAFGLSSSEANELSEIIKNNGIPVLIDKCSHINANSESPKNNNLYQLSVSPMHVSAAMGVINAHLNYSSDLDQNLFSDEEVAESNLIDGKSENAESKTASSNLGVPLTKLFVVIFFFLIDAISRKLFNFSIIEFFHNY